MASDALGTGAACALVLLVAAPYLARLTLSVPDRDVTAWWRGAAPSHARIAATGALVAVFGLLSGLAAGWSASLAAFVLLALLSAPLAVIDIEHHRLPNRLVFSAAIGAVVLLAVAGIVDRDWSALLRAAEAAVVVFVVFFGLTMFAPFGFGDTKLAAVLAGYLGWLGWGYVLYGLLAGFLVAAAVSLPMVLTRRANMKTAIPLGPALILGALLVAAFRLVPSSLT
jgi:leader peptidase (prepilin peptidase)/N-methyltransferase